MIDYLKKKFNIQNKKDFWVLVWQFVKFGIVGAFNTLLSLGVYYLLLYLKVNHLVANVIGFIVGIINAYFWNARYVFKKQENERRSLALSFTKVALIYTVTGFLSTALLYIWVDLLKISDKIGPLINLCITIPLNFLLIKFWGLKGKTNNSATAQK